MHDTKAAMKNLYVSIYPNNIHPPAPPYIPSSVDDLLRTPTGKSYDPPLLGNRTMHQLRSTLAPTTTLGMNFLVPNAGQPFATYTQPFAIAVGITTSTPTWYAAAQVYRTWALGNAPWLQSGLVANRTDMAPWCAYGKMIVFILIFVFLFASLFDAITTGT